MDNLIEHNKNIVALLVSCLANIVALLSFWPQTKGPGKKIRSMGLGHSLTQGKTVFSKSHKVQIGEYSSECLLVYDLFCCDDPIDFDRPRLYGNISSRSTRGFYTKQVSFVG